MSKSSPDLLQALLDRQRGEKQATAPAPPTPETEPTPPAPPLPVVEIKPKAPVISQRAPSTNVLASAPRGITLTFPMFLTALVVVGVAIVAAFLFGRFSSGRDGEAGTGQAASSRIKIPSPPSVPPFEWAKKFTVEAMSSGSSKGELDRLVDLSKYLGKLGVAATPFEVKESGKSIGAIFLGGADSGNDKSLVKLRDWLRDVPGPDGSGRPFQSARIRETPRPEKK